MWKTIEQAAKKGNRALAEIRERVPAGKQWEENGKAKKGRSKQERGRETREIPSRDSFAAMLSRPKKGTATSESAGSRPDYGKRKPGGAKHGAKSADAHGRDDDSDSDGGFFEED